MKRFVSVLCILFLSLLLLSAGCTGIPGIPQLGAPSGSPTPPVTDSTQQAAPSADTVPFTDPTGRAGTSWTGTYMTTWQGGIHDVPMELVQTGNDVTGTYANGDGTINGSVFGNRLIGTWTEDYGESQGPLEFEMGEEGRTFAGWWAYDGEDFSITKQDAPSWTGIRVS